MMDLRMLFPLGKSRCFTVSYDDGRIFDARLLGLLGKYGIKGTFNLNSAFLGWENQYVLPDSLPELYKDQEIASHTKTHIKMAGTDSGLLTGQVWNDRCCLEKLSKTIVTGFAYPFGVYDNKVIQLLKACGIQYARTVYSTHSFELPKDFLQWHPTCHHDDDDVFDLLEKFCGKDTDFLKKSRLFYLWGHSYEFDEKNNWDRIEEIFARVHQCLDEIWFATNGQIYGYCKAYEMLIFSAEGTSVYNPSSQTVWFAIDEKTYSIEPGKMINIAPSFT